MVVGVRKKGGWEDGSYVFVVKKNPSSFRSDHQYWKDGYAAKDSPSLVLSPIAS